MYQVRITSHFKKDLKRAKKRGLPIGKLEKIVDDLATGKELEPAQRDHALTGNWVGGGKTCN